jgi:hypothetical protein
MSTTDIRSNDASGIASATHVDVKLGVRLEHHRQQPFQ